MTDPDPIHEHHMGRRRMNAASRGRTCDSVLTAVTGCPDSCLHHGGVHMREMYKWRHRTGNVFAGIGEFRAVATRRDKPGESFAAAIWLVAAAA